MSDSDDDSDDSSLRSTGSHYESDTDDDLHVDAAPVPDGQWTYVARSIRGGKMYEGLSSRVLPNDKFQLKYNYADPILLEKTKVEVKHSLSAIRKKLRLEKGTPLDYVDAFAGAMPESFLIKFHEWLKAGHDAKRIKFEVSFVDIIEFIRCDVVLRLFNVSSSHLKMFGSIPGMISPEQLKRYNRVRDAMKVADMPAATRHAYTVSRGTDNDLTFAGPAAQTLDPIMRELFDAINNEWQKYFFAPGKSWIDVDDDKLNNCSPKWKPYGFKRTPTKEKKEKPVIHTAATVGSGHICRVMPDTIGLKLADMLKETIEKLCPNPSQRSNLCLFLDRGYLDLAKAQEVDITNLIQIICDLDCKFLGTVKDSAKFPFIFVEVNEDGKTVRNKRMMLQVYGRRSVWVARSKRSGGKTIQASVLRHGAGKKRGARIATNLPEAMTDAIVYETSASSELKRKEHAAPPDAPLQPGATINDEISHAWQEFHSSLFAISSSQRTVDWFLGRLYRFTSTTFHTAINVNAADYFNTPELKQLHQDILEIVQLNPRQTITFENAADLEEEDLPSQRNSLYAELPTSNRRHKNTSIEFWKKKRKGELQIACTNHGVDHPDFALTSTTVNVLARCLAEHFQRKAAEREAQTGTRVVADDDEENNRKAAIALLCRMVPYWFTKPLKSKAGGAIDQGSANEELVVKVLKKYLEKFTDGKYTSKKVKEFGLLAQRECHACSSSPDGVFPLLRREKDDNGSTEDKFVSLCGLEIKTRSAVKATADLYVQTLRSGEWVECDSGTEEFRKAVPDNAYRSQVCQHAAALGLDYILIAYCLPGSDPKRMVLVRVSEDHRAKIIRIERLLSTKYMKFAYDDESPREIFSLGEDYSPAYGYAQEHHTLELWLRIWVAYNKDLFEHGTPTWCRRLIDVATCLWNKCMGNVDTVRRTVTTAKAKRGRDAPGSLIWYHLMDYIFYQAFRVHQHSSIEGELESINTRTQFIRKRKQDGRSFQAFLIQFQCDLTPQRMHHYFPGLKERIDHMQPESITTLSSTEMNEATGAIQMPHDYDAETSVATGGYKKLKEFLDPNNPLCKQRLDTHLPHREQTTTKTEKDGKGRIRTKRYECILCCSLCDDNAKNPSIEAHLRPGKKSRQGRKTVSYCLSCQVYLCRGKCFESFHTKSPNIPPCCSALDRSLSRKTRSSSSASSVPKSSPPKATRKRRQSQVPAPSSPHGAITACLRGGTVHAPESSPSRSSPSRNRRRRNSPQSSNERSVRPRLSSPPKSSRSGWSMKGIFSSFSSKQKR